MSFNMSFQISTLREPLSTSITLIWFLPSMSSQVNLQSARPHKRLFTIVAFKGSFT